MNKNALRALAVSGIAVAVTLGASGTAFADHVDNPKPSGPPWSESADGLTFCFSGFCDNWDKLDNYVCTTGAPTAVACDVIMAGVRLLPPLNIGDLVPHNIIP
ncbi:hypothetical protein [Rhodococcus sp. (in: high G+C Gram-positive bacteria)]|uniref:hypothetical protein n=1 Tax=Rhodococcus sp. TaxID=1831 RepID=UPI00257A4B2C|nr:hypothetical protein [Rhodococcus sp. (in: high G+C Gram-positive bacteria)]MBQ7803956.1 hypothetical protein [Rhodococcus sp. (in: high G+C Gram-positive bacteria)]